MKKMKSIRDILFYVGSVWSCPFSISSQSDLEAHLDTWPERRCPDVVAELAQHTKEMASDILQNATIQLLKWNSNVPELEDKTTTQTKTSTGYK